jgi:voltage-gated potassium channel Kch
MSSPLDLGPLMADTKPPSRRGPGLSTVKQRTPIGRAWVRFVTDPASTRNAIVLIIVANLTTVLIGGILVWLIDRHEFQELSTAFWYTLQTITTVGYGDVTPRDMSGRAVGAAVMLLGIASLSILTATITSSFIEARQADRQVLDDADETAYRVRLEARLDELLERLDRIERGVSGQASGED